MDAPGKYAPTVAECKSDKPFRPLATRQHALGPYPFDPNLIAQGVPPDGRVTVDDNIFGPLGGMPPLGPTPTPPPGPAAAPSGYAAGPATGTASVATAHYDPRTGRFATPAGAVSEQSDVVSPGTTKSWQELVWSGGA
jgi:hypothetical protein